MPPKKERVVTKAFMASKIPFEDRDKSRHIPVHTVYGKGVAAFRMAESLASLLKDVQDERDTH